MFETARARPPRHPAGHGERGAVRGEASDGHLELTSSTHGGTGGAGSGTSDAGDGASVSVTDTLWGDAGGSLLLQQIAVGGASGDVEEGRSGRSGDGYSALFMETSASTLELATVGRGGDGGGRLAQEGTAAAGGMGVSIGIGTSSGGGMTTDTEAFGGDGGFGEGGADSGDGGDAEAHAGANTTADLHQIRVFGDAEGGRGGFVRNGSDRTRGGDGGDATSSSEANASGNAGIDLRDVADGGQGGMVLSGTGSGGDGGRARSVAEGRSGGTLRVQVTARATGGDGGHGRGSGKSGGRGGSASASADGGSSAETSDVLISAGAAGGDAGDGLDGARMGATGGSAFATAQGSGSGFVQVSAGASGGQGSERYGAAFARASAFGTSGTTRAVGATAGRIVGFMRGDAITTTLGFVQTQADVAVAQAAPAPLLKPRLALDLESSAIGRGLPMSQDIWAVLRDKPTVAEELEETDALALILLGGGSPRHGPSGAMDVTSSMLLDLDLSRYADREDRDLLVGLLQPSFTGKLGGGDSLTFTIRQELEEVFTQSFTSFEAAFHFFDDRVLDLGDFTIGLEGNLFLEFALDLRTSEPGASFATNFIVAVIPEPTTGTLVAFGLILLGVRARRRQTKRGR